MKPGNFFSAQAHTSCRCDALWLKTGAHLSLNTALCIEISTFLNLERTKCGRIKDMTFNNTACAQMRISERFSVQSSRKERRRTAHCLIVSFRKRNSMLLLGFEFLQFFVIKQKSTISILSCTHSIICQTLIFFPPRNENLTNVLKSA